MHLYEPGEKEG
jgi:hypothetical protein